jgi:hypothetical protein
MADGATARTVDWYTVFACVIPAALVAWRAVAEYGWLSVAFSFWYWVAVLAWIVCVVEAIRSRRRWWLLLTAPVPIYPMVLWVALMVSCLQGTCL